MAGNIERAKALVKAKAEVYKEAYDHSYRSDLRLKAREGEYDDAVDALIAEIEAPRVSITADTSQFKIDLEKVEKATHGMVHPAEAEEPESEGIDDYSFGQQAIVVAALKERWKQGIDRTRPVIDPIPGWNIHHQVFLIREWDREARLNGDVDYDAGAKTITVARPRK